LKLKKKKKNNNNNYFSIIVEKEKDKEDKLYYNIHFKYHKFSKSDIMYAILHLFFNDVMKAIRKNKNKHNLDEKKDKKTIRMIAYQSLINQINGNLLRLLKNINNNLENKKDNNKEEFNYFI